MPSRLPTNVATLRRHKISFTLKRSPLPGLICKLPSIGKAGMAAVLTRGLPHCAVKRLDSRRTIRAFREKSRPMLSRPRHVVRCTSAPKDDGAVTSEWLRDAPTVVGAAGIAFLLANRVLSNSALVTDASSAQSRADVLVIAMCASAILTGLSWRSLKPKEIVYVQPSGEKCYFLNPQLPPRAAAELKWVWETVSSRSACDCCVVYYKGVRLMQAGYAPKALARSGTTVAPTFGPIATEAMSSGVGNYFANLALYPGRTEFHSFFPENLQGCAVQPIGDRGVLVLGSGTLRGFTTTDQSWFSLIAQKLDNTLDSFL